MTRYTTTHPITGEAVEMPGVKRSGVKFATWAWFPSDGEWSWVGASSVDNLMKATKSARSVAPYASDWTATPVVETPDGA